MNAMDHTSFSSAVMREAADTPTEYPGMKLESCTNPSCLRFLEGGMALNGERSCTLWNPTLNVCTVLRRKKIWHIVEYSRARSDMDVWLGSLVVALELKEGYPDQLCLLKTGGYYQLIGQSGMHQTGHNDFEHTRQGSPGIFSF